MSDATYIKSYVSGLTAINEVRKRVVYRTYDIFFSCTDGCAIECMMFNFGI